MLALCSQLTPLLEGLTPELLRLAKLSDPRAVQPMWRLLLQAAVAAEALRRHNTERPHKAVDLHAVLSAARHRSGGEPAAVALLTPPPPPTPFVVLSLCPPMGIVYAHVWCSATVSGVRLGFRHA